MIIKRFLGLKVISLIIISVFALKAHSQIEFIKERKRNFAFSTSYTTLNNNYPDKYISGKLAFRISEMVSLAATTEIVPDMTHDNVAFGPQITVQTPRSVPVNLVFSLGLTSTFSDRNSRGSMPISLSTFFTHDFSSKTRLFPTIGTGILLRDGEKASFIFGGFALGYSLNQRANLLVNASLSYCKDEFSPSIGLGIVL